MLLAAMLFAVPAFADTTSATDAPKAQDATPAADAPKAQDATPATTPATEAPKTETPKAEVSMFQRARELAIAPFAFVLVNAPDRIAKETLGRLATIAYLNDTKFGKFLANEWTGRAVVGTVALVAAYKVYQAMNPQDEDADDVFGE